MPGSLAYGSGGSWFDPTTGAVRAVSLYYYIAGTLDPITVYSTSDLSIPLAIPVLTTGHGRAPAVWIPDMPNPGYRMRAFDQWSTLIEDVNNIPTATQAMPEAQTPEYDPENPDADPIVLPGDPRLYATGDIVLSFSNAQPRVGFVHCNGGSIGKATSTNVIDGGSANDDNEALFLWLWGNDLYGMLEVIGGRGTTAQGDWAAGKAIRTPDLMGRVPVGMDAMGTAGKNRLGGITYTAGNPPKVGAYGGAAPVKTLTLAELPAHVHTVTDPKHFHNGTGNTGTENVGHTHRVNGTTALSTSNHVHAVDGWTDIVNAGTRSGTPMALSAGSSTGQPSGGTPMYSISDSASDSDPGGTPMYVGPDGHSHHMAFWSGAQNVQHSHTLDVTSAGVSTTHTHPYTGATDAKATGITIDSTGSGTAWQLMPPFLQLCYHIKQ